MFGVSHKGSPAQITTFHINGEQSLLVSRKVNFKFCIYLNPLLSSFLFLKTDCIMTLSVF